MDSERIIEEKMASLRKEISALHDLKNKAYEERNELVQLLAATYSANGLGISGIRWGTEESLWPVVFIELASGEISFHIPSEEILPPFKDRVVEKPYIEYDDSTKRERIHEAIRQLVKHTTAHASK